MPRKIKYIVITPVRDEEEHVAAAMESMIQQTIRPLAWVIVDDGSSDKTGQIIDAYAARHRWIAVIHRTNRGFRKSGGGVVEAFYDGYHTIQDEDWDFVVKLDGDLTYSPDYFEKCFQHFDDQPKLGVGGGDIYNVIDGAYKLESNPRFHVRGATKIYRRACWEAIGGLLRAPGWDSIDELKANMLGWRSRSFEELHVVHHRITGSAEGALRDRVKHGVACYISGYHPLFLLASCMYRLVKRPFVLGSCAIAYGYVKGYVSGIPRVADPPLIKYVRNQQLRRLCRMETIWK